MSMPPEGGWQPPVPPPHQGQPYGPQFNPSGYNPQQPPPPGYPQGPWVPQPAPPPRSNKWLLIAVAVLLVAVSITGTLLLTRGGGDSADRPAAASQAPSDFASAGDTGPAKVITDEPTCKIFNGINNSVATVQANGWGPLRARLGPASEWTADERAKVEAVATAARNAGDQAAPLAKQTPNRVVRDLYEQFIAYGRAYADSVPTYVAADNGLASAFINASSALIGICNSVEYGSASRSLALPAAPPPTQVATPENPADPQRFVTSSSATCSGWTQRLDSFNAQVGDAWQNRDSSIPASQWTPEQSAVAAAAEPLLKSYASDMAVAGRRSNNPVSEDFAATGALYLQAYLAAGDTYDNADGWLNYTAFRFANLVSGACRAVAE